MEKNLKPRPFKLGTTSFIYPGHIIPNVRQIGAFFDEIELLVFESLPDEVLPSKSDVRVLAELGQDLDLSYNVHLPTDVSLTCDSRVERQKGADVQKKVVERFDLLSPFTFTLHLDMDRNLSGPEPVKAWKAQARQGLELWVPGLGDPSRVSVETLWYSPDLFFPLVREFGLGVCADAGHHFKYGYDLAHTFERFKDAITIVHLHGVDFSGKNPKDHVGLDRLPKEMLDQAMTLVEFFQGTLCLEVFNLNNLTASLATLSRYFKDIPLPRTIPGSLDKQQP
ncbi:MAG: sugar phosphate isomerase/epimerase [Desulfobacter sp.]|nr:sugar phosphate isomerase/epimerase [Desulfobacter sp.]WDP84121.1 MAG: sugar phosphate isomerase/epimerase [Desulfobacter sp.]